MLLQGKNAIITGCRRGIGRAILENYAANGANIWAHARSESDDFLADLHMLASKYNVSIWPLCFDMTDYETMKKKVKEIMVSKIPVDILVNNAGITYNSLFQMSSEENLRRQFEVNFFSVFIFTQYISKLMTRNKNGGSIVHVSSSAGLDGNPGKSVYGSSKAAVICMSNSIAAELGGYGIRSNCIAPGIVETEMLKTMPDTVVQEAKSTADLQRGGLPSEIGDAALFLGSDLSSYITGQVLRVDGGLKS